MTATQRSADGARLRRLAGPADPDRIVLLLHGGDEGINRRRVPLLWPPALRMALFAPTLLRADSRRAVYLLWNAQQGWDDGGPPVRDARWALAQLRDRCPGRPIVLVGHSMGGRVGARVLAETGVAGMVGLAAWLPAGETASPPVGRRVMLVHGAADRTVPAADGARWARRAATGPPDAVPFLRLTDGEHTMLRGWASWHRLAARGVGWVAAGASTPGPE
ncbi:alpha/beta hydrolase [Nakamurella lactea]|uniref:alpha/beta hydrolase n=1 Tax=Nakamurella lactea TaxID=459515 RepID=UPI0003FE0074|nr:alpha/beta fold hydrolase [Nakamurella lactea]